MPDRSAAARILVPAPARAAQGRRAGVVTRCTAAVVDLLVACVGVVGLYAAWAAVLFLLRPRAFHFPDPGQGWLLTALLCLLTAYLAFAWMTSGQTVGDRLLGLRVVNRHGQLPGAGLALVRAVLCVLFPILLFWVAVSRQNRSVQDLLLRTSVVYDWTAQGPGRR
ncbi:MAG: RDD family protein [Oryzihumus sp.]